MQDCGDGLTGLARVFIFACWLLVIFVPLGLWKLAELLFGMFRHVHWS